MKTNEAIIWWNKAEWRRWGALNNRNSNKILRKTYIGEWGNDIGDTKAPIHKWIQDSKLKSTKQKNLNQICKEVGGKQDTFAPSYLNQHWRRSNWNGQFDKKRQRNRKKVKLNPLYVLWKVNIEKKILTYPTKAFHWTGIGINDNGQYKTRWSYNQWPHQSNNVKLGSQWLPSLTFLD